MRDKYSQMKMNERRVQTIIDEWERSVILWFINPEPSNVYTLKRTRKFEIKSWVEDFVLCGLIYSFLIHNTNAQFIEHGNDVIMKSSVTVN